MKYCCDKFREMAEMEPHEAGVVYSGNEWCLNGCCGGGCFVIVGMNFCPFCGEDLALLEKS